MILKTYRFCKEGGWGGWGGVGGGGEFNRLSGFGDCYYRTCVILQLGFMYARKGRGCVQAPWISDVLLRSRCEAAYHYKT